MAEKNEKESFLGDHNCSTETDTEFDVVKELKSAVDGVEEAFYQSKEGDVLGKLSYIKFLLEELDDSLSGEYEELRRRRFITKKTV